MTKTSSPPVKTTPEQLDSTPETPDFNWEKRAIENGPIWEEISPFLDTTDLDYKVPEWTEIYDERYPDEIKNKTKPQKYQT
jgi:hypothetical protein